MRRPAGDGRLRTDLEVALARLAPVLRERDGLRTVRRIAIQLAQAVGLPVQLVELHGRHSAAQHVTARHVTARHVTARHSTTRHTATVEACEGIQGLAAPCEREPIACAEYE